MGIYLDNSATTRVYPEAAAIMNKVMTEDYGNPSSMHHMGVAAEKYIREATSSICRTLKARESEIVYTSGGTESDNLAILGTARSMERRGRHLVTTAIEHPAVFNTMEYLKSEGFEITYLPVDRYGLVSVEDVRKAVRPDTILVSVMCVNNEIGSRQPVEAIGAMLKAEYPHVLFHVDAVQGYGKYVLYPSRSGIDLLAFSGHKIHGPKGVGVLYIRDKVRILPVIFGGEQQKGIRSGTENVPGIAGIGYAASRICGELAENTERMYTLKEFFIQELQKMDDVAVHGRTGRDSAPHIISAGFGGVRSEVLLHALEERGIYVSSGSACASNHPVISSTLKSIGVSGRYIESTIRFSLSEFTTKEELEYTAAVLKELVPELRRFRSC